MTVHTSPADEFHPWCFCIPRFSGQLYPDMELIFHSLFGKIISLFHYFISAENQPFFE